VENVHYGDPNHPEYPRLHEFYNVQMPNGSLKKILIMGLGRFGGGVGVARYLAQTNPDSTILITDLSPQHELADSVAQLAGLPNIAFRLGEHRETDFTTASLVIANPAVPKPWLNTYLIAAMHANVPITTEIALLTSKLPNTNNNSNNIIAVTGTAGKSTTTAMIHHALTTLGHTAHLGGNIGGSLLNTLHNIKPTDPVVLELSSAQLYWLEHFRPAVAVVTNIANNHSDWHGHFDHYQTSKQKLLAHQQPTDAAILGPSTHHWQTNPHVTRTLIQGPHNFPSHPTSPNPAIPGEHNRTNAALATAAVIAYLEQQIHNSDQVSINHANINRTSFNRTIIDRADIEHAVASFKGLPHRLAFVADIAGVRCYNDSKSTTPTSLTLAVQSLMAEPNINNIHLIAGGYDKGNHPSEYADAFNNCKAVYLIGATAEALATAAPPDRAHIVGTLEHATDAALANAKPNDAILLSPGCASWDQFTNYEQRGNTFISRVLAYASSLTTNRSPDEPRPSGSGQELSFNQQASITINTTTPSPSTP